MPLEKGGKGAPTPAFMHKYAGCVTRTAGSQTHLSKICQSAFLRHLAVPPGYKG